jgi:tetratricopeptide (TPR) repeat protein
MWSRVAADMIRWSLCKASLLLLRVGGLQTAAKIVEWLVRTDPTDPESRRIHAWILTRNKRHKEAIREYRLLIEQATDEIDGPMNLAENLIAVKQSMEAKSIMEALAERVPTNVDVLHLLAGAYVGCDQLQDALVTYRRIVTLQPRDFEAYSNLAATLYQLGHWEDAVKYSRRALEIHRHPAPYHTLGRALGELGFWSDAVDAFRSAADLDLDPGSDEPSLHLAIALMEAGRHEEAVQILDQVTMQRTANGLALSTLSYVLRRGDRIDEAVATARTAVNVSSQLHESHRALGWALLKYGLGSEALECFRRALEIEADDADATLGLAAALSSVREYRQALIAFNDVLTRSRDILEDYPDVRPYLEETRRAIEQV